MPGIRIDPHVHFRGGKHSYKETIEHGLYVARQQGVEIVFDMPNKEKPVRRISDVDDVLMDVPNGEEDRYFLYIGATDDSGQLEEAVHCYNTHPRVIGIKMFTDSVGDLNLREQGQQKAVFSDLAGLRYRGVLTVHCEETSLLDPGEWDPTDPITHCYARPEDAEVEAVINQIAFAREAGFEGHLHIAHASSPKTVDCVRVAADEGMRISCEVTPHHVMWDSRMLERPEGIIYKMNPPLRAPDSVAELRELVKYGIVDCIGTDHAPHALGEKLFPPYLSGYPSLFLYKRFVEDLLPNEIGTNPDIIDRMTYGNTHRIFGDKLEV